MRKHQAQLAGKPPDVKWSLFITIVATYNGAFPDVFEDGHFSGDKN